jgi:hypothetical protein
MIVRVNSTERKRIPRSAVKVEVHDGQPRTFDATIDLKKTGLPSEAAVFLEAMCAGSNEVRRFSFGRVGRIAPPDDRRLVGMDGERVFFTLKVVDRSERLGRICGIAKNITPPSAGGLRDAGRAGILPIKSAELGHKPWRLDFGEQYVTLLVNQDIPNFKDLVGRDPLVYSLLCPAVIRQALDRALVQGAELDDDDRWPSVWLRFGRDLHPERADPPLPGADGDERDEWIEEVVDAFSKAHDLKRKFGAAVAPVTGGDE